MTATSRVPTSTYRIQLRDGLGLDDVVQQGWLDHARSLGISHLYLSPVLTATEGSTHGYDVVDPRHVDPALGGDEALVRLSEAAAARGMGLVIDIVPNHMAVDPGANPWWRDVLRNGRSSLFADTFDVDWHPAEQRLRGSIFLPVLGDHYGRVLDAGGIRIVRRGAEIVAQVDGSATYPLEPSSLAGLLEAAATELDDDLLRLVVRSLARLEQEDPEVRASELRVLDPLLAQSLAHPAISARVDEELDRLRGDVDRLHELLEAQHYRLAYWRAARDLGYRRFFDVNGLIGVRVELPTVFGRTHTSVRRWVLDDLVDGLRVDHPDGLREPGRYFEQLRALAPDRWIVAEKILESGEELPEDWAVDGTTGYDTAELIARWFVDPDGLRELGELRDELVGASADGEQLVEECKRLVLTDVLPADVNRVTDLFLRMCESMRRFRDATRHELHELVRETVTAFPVYRSYVAPGAVAGPADRALVDEVLMTVSARRPDLDPEFVDLFRQVLVGDLDEQAPLAIDVRMRVEQLTGPAMAKGKEDTAWYRDVRLLSRNEVGADPFADPLDGAGLHRAVERVAERWPATMTSLSTHDSKRGEDVRARLSALSEVPQRWATFAREWLERVDVLDPEGHVDMSTRYFLCQTVVGAHPLSEHRLVAYAEKAIREAKVHTSWLQPDDGYEAAVRELCTRISGDERLTRSTETFVTQVLDPLGRVGSVAQKVLQLCLPGVPDLYWGTEDWWFRLVDPDNRTPPDLERLRSLGGDGGDGHPDGAPGGDGASDDTKFLATRAVLRLRARRPDCFGPGAAYRPLDVRGPDADRVLGFVRGAGVVVLVSRFAHLGVLDPETVVELPEGTWAPVGSDGRSVAGSGNVSGVVPVAALLEGRPYALWEGGA